MTINLGFWTLRLGWTKIIRGTMVYDVPENVYLGVTFDNISYWQAWKLYRAQRILSLHFS
jgi:hypothetical protein